MTSYDLFDLAVRNLRQSKLRNGLTTVGISVGVASLVAMLSLGVGLQQLATRRLAGSGLFDTVFVTSRQDFRGFDREDDAKQPHPDQAPVLDEAARTKITHLPNVTEVEPEIRVMGEVMSNGETHFGFVTGLPMSAVASFLSQRLNQRNSSARMSINACGPKSTSPSFDTVLTT